MPAPGEEGDPKNMPTGPSVSLLLHQEFAAFRGTILGDIKGLLQAALQEVLDQHEVLLRNQEHTIRGHLDDHKGAIKDHLDDHVSLLSEKMASAAGPLLRTNFGRLLTRQEMSSERSSRPKQEATWVQALHMCSRALHGRQLPL
jgi:hypothetical protein